MGLVQLPMQSSEHHEPDAVEGRSTLSSSLSLTTVRLYLVKVHQEPQERAEEGL